MNTKNYIYIVAGEQKSEWIIESRFPEYPVINAMDTGRNIRRIMEDRGISVRDLQKYLGLAVPQGIYHWLDGRSIPSVDNLYAMSELFRIPIDKLLVGNRQYGCADKSASMEERIIMYYNKILQMSVAKSWMQ